MKKILPRAGFVVIVEHTRIPPPSTPTIKEVGSYEEKSKQLTPNSLFVPSAGVFAILYILVCSKLMANLKSNIMLKSFSTNHAKNIRPSANGIQKTQASPVIQTK